jgi:hypothetical protein
MSMLRRALVLLLAAGLALGAIAPGAVAVARCADGGEPAAAAVVAADRCQSCDERKGAGEADPACALGVCAVGCPAAPSAVAAVSATPLPTARDGTFSGRVLDAPGVPPAPPDPPPPR